MVPWAWHRLPGCLAPWDGNKLVWNGGLERTGSSVFWWRSCGTLIFENPKSRELTISEFWGRWTGEGV